MEFSSFDLEVLGEIQRILRLLGENPLVAMEQRNRATFCEKYCHQLQGRVKQQVINEPS